MFLCESQAGHPRPWAHVNTLLSTWELEKDETAH